MTERKHTPHLQATIVVPTIGRVDLLKGVLRGWQAGTHLPLEVVVVDGSDGGDALDVCQLDWAPLSVSYLRSFQKSAAHQRNLGAARCATDVVVFCDDDLELPPESLELLLRPFEEDAIGSVGGVAGVIVGMTHKPPGTLLRWFYHLQAGYAHPHYGGRFFGAAINLLPTDQPDDPALYPSEWLNSGLVAYRTEAFESERFPNFEGYSFQEDVSLSFRVGRTHQLYFNRDLRYMHLQGKDTERAQARPLGRMMFEHRWRNATELLGLQPLERKWKFTCALAFDCVSLVRARPHQWPQTVLGLAAGWWWCAVLGHTPAGAPRNG